jgi:hypothetical protein
MVVSTSGSAELWDLWTLAVRLDDYQHIPPAGPCLFPVLTDISLQTDLMARIREAQELDPVTADIKNTLANPYGAPPPECTLYQLHDRLLVVPEPDG